MQAEKVFATSVGGSEVLKVKKVSIAEPGDKECLVDVKSCSLNFFDLYVRQGHSPDVYPPCVLGMECAGVIEMVGKDVTSVKVGDRVIVHCPKGGSLSEKIITTEDLVLPFPESVDFDSAACLTITYLTAYFCLYNIGGLKDGATVFIQGAAGGVGWAATQLAKSHTGVTVFGTSSVEKHEAIQENGVDYPLTYEQDIKEEILKHSPEGVDIVIENMAGKDFQKCMDYLAPLGKIVLIGAKNMMGKEKRSIGNLFSVWWNTKNFSVQSLIMKNRCVAGFHLNELQKVSPTTFRQGWEHVLDLLIHKKITPHIDSTFSFSQIAEACSRLSQRKNIGKVIIRPNTPEPQPDIVQAEE